MSVNKIDLEKQNILNYKITSKVQYATRAGDTEGNLFIKKKKTLITEIKGIFSWLSIDNHKSPSISGQRHDHTAESRYACLFQRTQV